MPSRPVTPGRLRRLLDVAGAALAVLLAFTAVPIVLVVVVGDPLSGGLGHGWSALDRDALSALALAAWVAWAACCLQLLRAVVAHVRRGEVTARSASVLDQVAARIAVGVLALSSIGGPLAVSTMAGASTAAPPITTSAAGLVDPQMPRPHPPRDTHAAPASHTVRPGETLWAIAHDRLGDGADWTALAAMNLDRAVGDGLRFVDPDHVEPGWRLDLGPITGVTGGHRRAHDGLPRTTRRGAAPGGHPGHLPELVALGLGSLACAGLARRTGRRRPGEPFFGELAVLPPLSEEAVDAATLLRRFEGVPALRSFEAANRLLAGALVEQEAPPRVRAVCVSPAGVSFWFAGTQAAPPHPFAPSAEGDDVWHVDHTRLEELGDAESTSFDPYTPIVLPVGDDGAGTWLVVLGPGQVLPVLGEDAPALARSVRAAMQAWSWSDTVLATDDPGDQGLLAEAAADHHRLARPLLFFGDPRSLPDEVAAHTAVVTTAAATASDLTVLVDRHGATLHPMGRVVRPPLQSEETGQAIAELVALGRRPDPPPRPEARPAPVAGGESDPHGPHGPHAWAPGIVDVRLLTTTPRLDGLGEDLPANRARRSTELVAYLALHRPDVVTSDRLRTRVLGSSDSDAASKTLFNIAYAARRALGTDARGDPLLPPASRNGLYRISPEVTVDVHRAIALAAEGRAHVGEDRDVAIACARAALELVEGEPLANALSGYSWWEAEGHGGRVAAALVDAACSMASLAAEAGHFALAWWGLERARVVEPYSEVLSRAAMQLAAAEGDAERLRLEWRECQRRLDALDPGCSPSPRTESLYGELSRLVHSGRSAPGQGDQRLLPAADS